LPLPWGLDGGGEIRERKRACRVIVGEVTIEAVLITEGAVGKVPHSFTRGALGDQGPGYRKEHRDPQGYADDLGNQEQKRAEEDADVGLWAFDLCFIVLHGNLTLQTVRSRGATSIPVARCESAHLSAAVLRRTGTPAMSKHIVAGQYD